MEGRNSRGQLTKNTTMHITARDCANDEHVPSTWNTACIMHDQRGRCDDKLENAVLVLHAFPSSSRVYGSLIHDHTMLDPRLHSTCQGPSPCWQLFPDSATGCPMGLQTHAPVFGACPSQIMRLIDILIPVVKRPVVETSRVVHLLVVTPFLILPALVVSAVFVLFVRPERLFQLLHQFLCMLLESLVFVLQHLEQLQTVL